VLTNPTYLMDGCCAKSAPHLEQSETTCVDGDYGCAHDDDDRHFSAIQCRPSVHSTVSNSLSPSYSGSDGSPASTSTTDVPLLSLLLGIAKSDEDLALEMNGYRKLEDIAAQPNAQGEVFVCEISRQCPGNAQFGSIGSRVVVKKIDKALHSEKLSTTDEDGFVSMIDANVVEEARLLKWLTHNYPTGGYVVEFVQFFEFSSHYYLVTEHVDGISLREFVDEAHALIRNGALDTKEWGKVVKFILWQLVVTVRWLHVTMHCCHLNLSLENVRVQNAYFRELGNGKVGIPTNFAIKIDGFEFAELFQGASFRYNKEITSAAPYLCPEQYSQSDFDARKADLWAIGQCFYWMVIGSPLYTADDAVFGANAFRALRRNKLSQYLHNNDLLRCFKRRSFSLLSGLLTMDENQRFDADDAMKHSWFKSYWTRYGRSIERKYSNDVQRNRSRVANVI